MTAPSLSVSDALETILGAVSQQATLRIPLAHAIGRILAADLVSAFPLPPWTNAAMDGYAARSEDAASASTDRRVRLEVVGAVAAGDGTPSRLAPGTAMRIFTGGRVPDGADSVIRQEDTDRGSDIVTVHSARDCGANVRAAGGDLASGSVALAAGTRIGPAQLALLAALGEQHPMVVRAPRVGVLSGGDELASSDNVDAVRSGAMLADVNAPMLCALIEQAGGVANPLGIARDEAGDVTARVSAADDCDVIITAGGVSVGDHDHVHAAMAALGARELVSRVKVRPGGPTAFALLPDGRPWLALPGNPVSAFVTFHLFGRPMIRKMAGDRMPIEPTIPVLLEADVTPDAVLDLYLRVTLQRPQDGSLPVARLTGPQGSGMLSSVARADALVVVKAGSSQPSGTTLARCVKLP